MPLGSLLQQIRVEYKKTGKRTFSAWAKHPTVKIYHRFNICRKQFWKITQKQIDFWQEGNSNSYVTFYKFLRNIQCSINVFPLKLGFGCTWRWPGSHNITVCRIFPCLFSSTGSGGWQSRNGCGALSQFATLLTQIVKLLLNLVFDKTGIQMKDKQYPQKKSINCHKNDIVKHCAKYDEAII